MSCSHHTLSSKGYWVPRASPANRKSKCGLWWKQKLRFSFTAVRNYTF